MDLNNEGETAMSTEAKNFHFNVNVRTNSGSKAAMANNEDSFLRAMEIQERKQEKKELEKLEEERIAAAQAPAEIAEPVLEEETEVVETEEAVVAEVITEVPAEPETPKAPKPGGVPGPTPRRDFTAEERAGMLKRAKAHAAEVQARKK